MVLGQKFRVSMRLNHFPQITSTRMCWQSLFDPSDFFVGTARGLWILEVLLIGKHSPVTALQMTIGPVASGIPLRFLQLNSWISSDQVHGEHHKMCRSSFFPFAMQIRIGGSACGKLVNSHRSSDRFRAPSRWKSRKTCAHDFIPQQISVSSPGQVWKYRWPQTAQYHHHSS